MNLIFNKPLNLYFLLFIPIVILTHYLVLRFTKKEGIPFSNYDTLSRISKKYVFSQNNNKLILRILCLIFICFSLSSPIISINIGNISENTLFLVDASDSSLQEYNGKSVFNISKEVLNSYISNKKYLSIVSVISYSTISKVIVPPTRSTISALEKTNNISVHNIGGTDLGTALINSIFLASNSNINRIIVLSDGHSYFGTLLSEATELAIKKGVRIDFITINLKTSNTNLERVYKKISFATKGDYLSISEVDVNNIKDKILHSKNSNLVLDVKDFLLVIAFLLLIFEWVFSNLFHRTMPYK